MQWKEHYRQALTEVDSAKLLTAIGAAEGAIALRSEVQIAVTGQELQEMSDASSTLRILKNHAQTGCA